MTVNELIAILKNLPQGAQVKVQEYDECRDPETRQEWNDFAENYIVVL